MWSCHNGMTRSDEEVSAGTPQESNTINGWEDKTLAALDPRVLTFYDPVPFLNFSN